MERDKDEHALKHEREAVDSKNSKSKRKKKEPVGKKSKKKKSKQEPQLEEKFSIRSKDLDLPCANQNGEDKGTERLEKETKGGTAGKGGEKGGVERHDDVRGEDNDDKIERQHSMPRSRSGSRSRISSLFRRKKRSQSETDLRKETGNMKNEGGGDKEEREDGKHSESHRRKGKRHTSVEDLKKKQQKSQKDDSSLTMPQKSSLKRSSPYREFSPTSRPRDRLQHMTLREVAKEQRERRSESLPRRRREYVSFDDRDDPMSSSNFSASPSDFGDGSPETRNFQTLPRETSRFTPLTPYHSNSEGTGRSLQRPPDNVMESSQDSGVVALGQPQPRRSSSAVRQEKTSIEKLLELKQNFPHAFSYDGENNTTLSSEQKGENDKDFTADTTSMNDIRINESRPKIQTSGPGPLDKNKSSLQSVTTAEHAPISKTDIELSNTNHTIHKTNVPQSTYTASTSQPTATTTARTQQSQPSTRQQVPLTATKITASPSFLAAPYSDDGNRSGASSRVTSMTSSHRSSDLGYVDGDDSVPDDDDDDDDDDNSAFSTPPEDLVSDSHKHKSYIHPEMLEKYLSSVLQNNAGQNMPLPDIDIYEGERGKKVYPNATLPSSSRKMAEPYQTYEVRKASRNLKRSSSDVIDRRHKTPPKNHSGTVLGEDHSTHPKSPIGSIDTLSDMSLGNTKAIGKNLSNTKEDLDGDRASLTSTGTLTQSDAKAMGLPFTHEFISNREEKPADIKSVPVMGTAAQSINRRNFSPLRTRKMYLPDFGSPQSPESLQKDIEPKLVQKQKNIPTNRMPENNTTGSFQPISSSDEDFPISPSAFQRFGKDDKIPSGNMGLETKNELQCLNAFSNEPVLNKPEHVTPDYSIQNKDLPLETQLERPTPAYLITGLELQAKSPMPKKINSLVDCLNDQSVIAQKKDENRKISVDEKQKDKTEAEKSVESEGKSKHPTKSELKESTVKTEAKSVSLQDKECQTPPWLLDDLIASKTDNNKKSKGLLGRRKKQSVVLKPFATPLSPDNKDSLEIITPSGSVSPNTASVADGAFVTPPSTAENDRELILRLDAPIPQDSGGISSMSQSPGTSKRSESKDTAKASEDIKSEVKPNPKSKPLSLSAVILLKNRIKNYRDKKKEKKEAASANNRLEEEEVKADPETQTDAFMTIENEINLSKLEVSRETDILDADYFEPEFSLDYSKKQIRFEDITPPNEPVQSEEPLPPLPPTATRRLRQRRESTMREKRRKCISYCKRFVAFLFSHIGLCSLVVAYTILGGFIFQALESQAETAVKTDIKTKRGEVLERIISMAVELEKSEESVSNLTSLVNSTLLKWQTVIHHATKDQGWDGTEKTGNEGVWSFASSLLYAITVTTTIGYGHVAPKTPEGRLVTIGYAVVGIPLTLLCLTNIGDVMATGFRLLYGKVCCGICCTMFKPRRRRIPPDLEKGLGRTMITSEKEESDKPKEVIHVPTSLCLLLIAAYIFAGAMLFSMWEKWDILTGSYFCFITLSTIGFGDIVPGMETNAWSGEEKLVLCALYLVLGLSLIAMCFNLVQEDVKTKCRWLGMKLGIVDKPETPM